LRTHLIALAAAALLPALAVGAIAVGAAVDTSRQAFEDRLAGTAGALASAVDTEITASVLALSTLATAYGLDDEADLSAFRAQAKRTAAMLGTRIFLVAPDASVVLNTAEEPGAPSAPVQPQTAALVRQVLEGARPAVGDLIRSRRTGDAVAPVLVPVWKGGEVAYALGSVVEAARISRLLAEQAFRDGGYAGLVDGAGRIVARSVSHDRYTGQQVRDWVVDGARTGPRGILHGPNLAGVEITTAFRHLSGAPGWFVTVAEPRSTYLGTLWPPLATLALGGLGSAAVALLVAMRIGKRVLRPVRSLTRWAEAVAASGGGASFAPDDPARVREFAGLQRAVRSAEETLRERAAAVAAGEARLRAVVDTATDAIVVIDEAGAVQSFNRAAEAIFGYAAGEVVGRNVSALMEAEHAGRHDGYLAAYRRTGARKIIGVGREVEGRRKDGSPVPLDLSIAEWRDAGGKRFFTGIMRDISARKAGEARRALLAREVDHRAKNALAVVQSVLRLTPRDEPAAFAAAVEARVAALARVHSLLAEGGWSGADLRAVAERELAPYAAARRQGEGAPAAVLLDGPPVPLAPAAVQPFAMVLHELATNAAKHGALSAPGGRVELRWRAGRRAEDDGFLRLRWAEAGGPLVAGPPARRGFGARVVEATVRGQLGGAVVRRWEPSGLVVEVAVPLARAAAGGAEAHGGSAAAAIPSAA
jgi:PAS domain S-box-containing protein